MIPWKLALSSQCALFVVFPFKKRYKTAIVPKDEFYVYAQTIYLFILLGYGPWYHHLFPKHKNPFIIRLPLRTGYHFVSIPHNPKRSSIVWFSSYTNCCFHVLIFSIGRFIWVEKRRLYGTFSMLNMRSFQHRNIKIFFLFDSPVIDAHN